MRHSYRQQNHGRNLEISAATFVVTPPEEDQTRQEFKDEADLNWLLDRYQVPPQGRSPAQYGVVNFDDDLTTAFEAVERARDAWEALPDEVKELYPSWQSLAEEIARGDANPALGEELAQALKDAETAKANAEAERVAAAAAGSSAAGGAAPSSEARQ